MPTPTPVGPNGKQSRSNMRVVTHMDPKDLSEYLQQLIDVLADDRTSRKCEDLVATNYEYTYVIQ